VNWLWYALAAAAGYLLGSVPTGYWVARRRGVDIRALGSGNIGATNVFRTLGKGPGVLVLLVDALKGAGSCGGALALAHQAGLDAGTLGAVGGVAAVLGHNYTCWLGFKGGKGIATTAGVLAVLLPAALGLCLAAWLLVFLASRYVSLASVVAAVVLPLAAWGLHADRVRLGLAAVAGALAVYKHRVNLQRLCAGTEHRFGQTRPPPPEGRSA
jgi:glycerol-3-phosphate acyltransferase PlsY